MDNTARHSDTSCSVVQCVRIGFLLAGVLLLSGCQVRVEEDSLVGNWPFAVVLEDAELVSPHESAQAIEWLLLNALQVPQESDIAPFLGIPDQYFLRSAGYVQDEKCIPSEMLRWPSKSAAEAASGRFHAEGHGRWRHYFSQGLVMGEYVLLLYSVTETGGDEMAISHEVFRLVRVENGYRIIDRVSVGLARNGLFPLNLVSTYPSG